MKEACRKHERTHILVVFLQLNDAARISMTLFGQILHSSALYTASHEGQLVGKVASKIQKLHCDQMLAHGDMCCDLL